MIPYTVNYVGAASTTGGIQWSKPTHAGKGLGLTKKGTFFVPKSSANVPKFTSPAKSVSHTAVINRLLPAAQAKVAAEMKGQTESPQLALLPTLPSARVSAVTSPGGAVQGVNALDNYGVNGVDLEPPDQGLCAGNGYVIDVVNLVWAAYSIGPPISRASADISVPAFFGVIAPIVSDPRCIFDSDSGHWFMTVLFSDGATYSFTGIAVSVTGSPLGFWNVYYLETDTPLLPNCFSSTGVTCLGDQPLLGADKYALYVSTNQFPLCTITCVTAQTFDGSASWLLDKWGLALGWLPGLISVAEFDIGEFINVPNTPGCTATLGFDCWYSIQPQNAPDPTQYDTSSIPFGIPGHLWALSSMDFGATSATSVAAWVFVSTASLHNAKLGPNSVAVGFEVAGSEEYDFPLFTFQPAAAASCAAFGATCNIPLGNTVFGATATGLINPDDDRMQTVTIAQGVLWSSLSSLLLTPAGLVDGIAYFNFPYNPTLAPNLWTTPGGTPFVNGKLEYQGYVAATGGASLVYPAVAALSTGTGLVSFGVVSGTIYPSAAYIRIAKSCTTAPVPCSPNSISANPIKITGIGAGPTDGFTEYIGTPRWGDYSWAVGSGTHFYYAAEYIAQSCTDATFTIDPSCGGTRSFFANWSTAIGTV